MALFQGPNVTPTQVEGLATTSHLKGWVDPAGAVRCQTCCTRQGSEIGEADRSPAAVQ